MGAWIEILTVSHSYFNGSVAPRMGAWIEIKGSVCMDSERKQVAPRMGAWIEIMKKLIFLLIACVAPRMGAWIEI